MSSPESASPQPSVTLKPELLADLPENVRVVLTDFLEALSASLGAGLRCVFLFGSAAEGRLRATSDVNLAVIATQFTPPQLQSLRLPLQSGRAAVALTVMFLESAEFALACDSFAMKFADMQVRHRVLYGIDPFETVKIPRQAELRRLRQVLLNLKLRLREHYALQGDRPESLASFLADLTGPIRVAAATLLALLDAKDRPPKAALEEFCSNARWASLLSGLSQVHRGEVLAPTQINALIAEVLTLLNALSAAVPADIQAHA